MKASEIKSVTPITPDMTNYQEGQRFVTPPPNGSDYLAMLGVFSRQNGGFETFNAAVSTAIGGYYAGAVLTYLDTDVSSPTFGQYTKVISCIDDNTDNFVEHPDHIDAWFEGATSMTVVPEGTEGAVQHWKRVAPMIPTADGNKDLASVNVKYTKDKLSDKNHLHDDRYELKGQGGGSIRVPILTPMWFDHVVIDDTGWILSDGEWKNKSDAELIYTHLVEDWNNSNSVEETETIGEVTITFKRASDGHKIVTVTNDNLDTLFEATGVAWYYVLDTVNEKFRLPRTKFGFQGVKIDGSVGKYDAPGLPDHYHSLSHSTDTVTTLVGSSHAVHAGSGANTGNAIDSRGIYGASDTVQPPATEMLLYFSTGVGGSGSDVINVGGGGVINVEMYTLSNGDIQVLKENVICPLDYTTAETVYIVENDCLLAIKSLASEKFEVSIYVNDSERPVITTCCQKSEMQTNLIPVKKGSKIKFAVSDGTTASKIIEKVYFEEFKLHSLVPQIAMPDWDESKIISSDITSPYSPTMNGYFYATGGSAWDLKINGISLPKPGGNNSTSDLLIPVTTTDILTWSNISNIKFIPCKSVHQKSEKEDILNLLYPVGSIYFDGNDGEVCPLQAVISGSTWEEVGTKLLTGGSTAPVVGNGITLGLTDGSNNFGFFGATVQSLGGSFAAYGTTVGTSASQTGTALTKTVGVSDDPTKSGLVAQLGSATGITVKIWKRTA